MIRQIKKVSISGHEGSPMGDSSTDPLLPPPERQDDNNHHPLQLNTIPEEDISQMRLNESTEHHQDGFYPGCPSNIRRILALTWFGYTGRAIWSQNILSIFIFLLYPQQVERVGYVTAAMGLSQVLSTRLAQCPTLANYQRHHLLRVAAAVGLGATGATMYGIMVEVSWYWLVGGLMAWSFMWGFMDAILPSLFADSLPELQEVIYYTRASRVVRSSNTTAPLMVLGLFWYFLGDQWTVHNCAVAMAVGTWFCVPMILLLLCLREIEDDVQPPDEIHWNDMGLEIDDGCEHDCEWNTIDNGVNVTEETEAITMLLDSSDDHLEEDEEASPTCCGCCPRDNVVHVLISMGSVLSGIASGVSIRYFPIFFVKELNLTPIFIQVLYLITPLGQASVKCLSKALARLLGASCVTNILQWAFVTVLFTMLYCFEHHMSVWLVCPLYLWHAFLVNSTTALTQSILWSTQSGNTTSRWNVTENFQLLLWSIGAGGGGYLVGSRGMMACFYTTAVLQVLASLPGLFLCCVGPSREKVNNILFPVSPSPMMVPFARFHDDDESSRNDATNFEDSRDIEMDDSDGSWSVEYFECGGEDPQTNDSNNKNTHNHHYHHRSNGSSTAVARQARYDVMKRCCIYEDGSPAYVPSCTSIHKIPSNYLAICRGNADRAQQMWKATQQWRKVEQVWQTHTLHNPWYVRIKEAYPHYMHGISKDGYPVIYEKPGKMKLKELFREGCTIADMTRWYTFFMEYLSNCVVEQNSHHRGDDWGFMVVMDMRGAGISMLSRDVLSYLKQAGKINATHYPLSMKRSFLVHANSLVANVWMGIKTVLPESVHVEVFQSPTSLFTYIDEDQIPHEYGGSSSIELGQHPHELALCSLLQSLSN